MPDDKFLFFVTGNELVKGGYIGKKELDFLPNAHLEKGAILRYFLDYQEEETGKTWYFEDTGKEIVVYPEDGDVNEFHCVQCSDDAEGYPRGTFYADMSEYESSDIINYYEVI
ncbi:MAG: hypothetical protein J6P77_05655 [Acetobacter sp.]|nr:hypothetical protein [Acetobacter sp.]